MADSNLKGLNAIAESCGGTAQDSNAKAIKEISDRFSGVATVGDLVVVAGTGTDSIIQTNNESPNIASGDYAIALGYGCTASAYQAISLGRLSEASGQASIAIGNKLGSASWPTTASANGAIAIGSSPKASGQLSVAIGQVTQAVGSMSFALGNKTEAKEAYSVAIGNVTLSSGRACTVIGQANIEDDNPVDATHGAGARKYLFIIGNGSSANARSNAMTVDWDGNIVAHNLPEPPSADGTYTLKCTVSSGVATYAWV